MVHLDFSASLGPQGQILISPVACCEMAFWPFWFIIISRLSRAIAVSLLLQEWCDCLYLQLVFVHFQTFCTESRALISVSSICELSAHWSGLAEIFRNYSQHELFLILCFTRLFSFNEIKAYFDLSLKLMWQFFCESNGVKPFY